MIVAAQDSDTLQAHAKTVELEKMLMEQKLNQEQAAAAKAHAKQLEFEKQKMKLEFEHHQKIRSLKEPASMSTPDGESAVRIAKMPKLVILKFDRTPQDWVRFWGEFFSEIDSSHEQPIRT